MATLQKIQTASGPADTSHLLDRLRTAIGAAIRGKDDVIQLALVALFARGHLLIEDVPGVGKTTLARALARSVSCSFQRIQFTSDMLPSDVIGVSVFNPQSQQFEFRPGPVFANIVLADEINRTTPKTQSALLEAMNEAQVTLDNGVHPLPHPFMVIATQNPVEHHGTFPIPESQLDRFLMRVEIGYPAAESEKEILRNSALSEPVDGINAVISMEEVAEVQQAARHVTVDDDLMNYLLEIVTRTRQHEQLSLGVSPRGSMSLYRAAQARALLEDRNYCIPDDFKSLAVPVFAHRCVVSSQFASLPQKGARAAAILQEILEETPVPL
ncbi:MAG TPA: MoxR family ATPase [Terriglobia bacterium]|nr:MoxR family ATPase [Terriglobia bacterium]